MKSVHLFGGPLDGDQQSWGADVRQVYVPQFGLSYIYSETWSCHFQRPTFICSNHKGLPPSGKGVEA